MPQVVISVRDEILRTAAHAAEESQRRVEEVLADWLERAIIEMPVETLSDEEIRTLTEQQLKPEGLPRGSSVAELQGCLKVRMRFCAPKEKVMTNFAPFDAADYLDDEETIAEYLTAALEDPDPGMFFVAVKNVARARGMTQLARDTGLGRESLYKALAPGANPRYDTVLKVLRAFGVKLHAESVHS